MNDDGLSPREHAEMRDLVLAGTQRIKPVGAHRNQFVAGALALVLVGAVSGAAITTAAIFGTDAAPVTTPSPTVTVTPAPTPTPTPTPSPSAPAPVAPAEAVLPFGGECESALTDGEATAAAGIDMVLSDYRWRTGADEVLGGIDCVWLSPESYMSAVVKIIAFPLEIVPSTVSEAVVPGCVDLGYEGPLAKCSLAGVVGGTWLIVQSVGDPNDVSEAAIQAAFDRASANLAAFPPASPAVPNSAWWAPIDCSALVDRIDSAAYGFERIGLLEEATSSPDTGSVPEGIADRARSSCDLHFTAGSGENTSGEVVTVSIIPGGAVAYRTAAAAEEASAITVTGAEAAVIVPGSDRYEGSPAVIVATDGTNALVVTPDVSRETSDAGTIVAAVFALMRP